jgi:cyclase
MKTNMHHGASNRIFSNAKELRNRETFAEKLLWSRLRNKQLGYHFRRQHPISNYIVDFFCFQLKLVVEVDGSIHADKIVQFEDQEKMKSLISFGLEVIRFTNDEVIKNVDAVVDIIKKKIIDIKEKGPL